MIRRARRRRRWRVRFLSAAHWLTALCAIVAWWLLGDAGLSLLGRPVVAVAGYVTGILPGVDSEKVAHALPQAFLGMVAVAVIASLWLRWVVNPVWVYWDSVEGDVLFRREQLDMGLASERALAVSLFALTTAISVCVAFWSPTLLQLAVINLRRVQEPTEREDVTRLMTQWPWDRHELLNAGPWAAPIPAIGGAILIATFIFVALIWTSIRSTDQDERMAVEQVLAGDSL